tara:strand:- start:238 stop:825 length:588 start_codon:yes stop_codon:yes gene_type:complete
VSGNDDKKNNISDEELSLISIIANLENKLEELDHNISLLSKDNTFKGMNSNSDKVIFKKINEIENNISRINKRISDIKENSDADTYVSTMPSRSRINLNKRGYAAANNLRLKRIESIEKKLNDFIKEYNVGTNKPAKYVAKPSYDRSESEVTLDDYYARSRGIFFGFLFSIILIFLLIMVSTKSYFYFEFIRNLV